MAMTDQEEIQPPVFDMEISQDSGAIRVLFSGELDFATAPNMWELFLHPDVVGASQVRVDLTDVTFFDSSALGVIVAACRKTRETDGRTFSVTCPDGLARRVLEISGLIDYLQVEDRP